MSIERKQSKMIFLILVILIGLSYTKSMAQSFTRITMGDGGSSGGVSWGDYDDDGDLDLFVSNRDTDNFLYRNDGNGNFTRIFSGVIVNDGGNSNGPSWGDYNNDGDLDLFVANFKTINISDNFLYDNIGNSGTFNKITSVIIVNDNGSSFGGGWGDYDSDGNLDLFVANDGGQKNFLYRNNGNSTFTKITSGAVVTDGGSSGSVSWGDYDNDDDLDLFVANKLENNFLYQNNGNGNFTKITSGDIVNDGGASVGGSWADYDNDGDIDLFVTNEGGDNFLYENNGDGTFTRISNGVVVNDGGASAGSSWGDYDNDGDLDLFVTNIDGSDNFLYQNNGPPSFTFTKVTSGGIVNDGGASVACAWADYDNDGDLDLAVANKNSQNNFLYRNNGNSNNWINIRCVGTVSNTSAIGAKIKVTAQINGASVQQLREISGQTGYLSQNSLNAEFGLGDANTIDRIEIEWPSGIVQVLTNQDVNQFLAITESELMPPSSVAATAAGSNQVDLSWVDNSDNETGFRIERSINGDGYSFLGNVGANVTSFSDTSLSPNTTYQYRVRAENSVGNSAYATSNPVTTDDVSPNSPSNFVVTAISSNRVDLNWDDNSDNETQFRIERRLGTSGSFGFLANVAADVTNYGDIGRSPNTTYQYRVRAENSVGNSAYATSNSVTTDDVPPDSPSNLVATAIASNQVDLDWVDNSDNETQFLIERRIDNGSFNFLTTVGANVTSFPDTNVSPDTTYQYRIRAENSIGNSNFVTSNAVTTPDSTGDQAPPQISHSPISSGTSGQSLTISAIIVDNVEVQSATLFYRRGGVSSYTSIAMTNSGGDVWEETIPASFVTERGVEYNFSTQDPTGNTTTFPSISSQNNPQVIQVTSSNLSFSSPNLTYRMISVPIDLDDPSPSGVLVDDLGSYDDTQWRLLKYINGINQEFTKASIGNFEPGSGFWLITRGAKTIGTGSGKSVTTAQNYEITLQPGWNQIGNPFAFAVNWQDVIRSSGDVEDVLVGYQGSTNDATGYDFTRTQLQPFQGYFVNNREATSVTIEIPPQSATGTTSLAKQAGLPDLLILQSDEWFLQLTAQSDRFLDKDNYIGVLNEAADTWDRNDFSEAPFFDSFVSLYFPHEDWEVYPGFYTGDFRSINSEGHFWDFHIKSNIANSEVVLTLAHKQNLPSKTEVVLIDKASRISIRLLEQDSYTFPSGEDGAERDFRIVVGRSDFVDSNDLDFSGIP